MIPILIVIFAVVVLPAVYVLAQYNALVALRNYIRESWSDVDVELKRRYDLIPNLVAVVRGYAAHEREVFERVTELRNRCAANNGPVADQSRDEVQLVDALKQLLVVVENYPQLKADQNFLKLQTELVNTEDRIQAARRFYNGNVRDYRNKCETFPSNLVAEMFGFKSEGRLFQRATVGPGRTERGLCHVVAGSFSGRVASPRRPIGRRNLHRTARRAVPTVLPSSTPPGTAHFPAACRWRCESIPAIDSRPSDAQSRPVFASPRTLSGPRQRGLE